MIDVGIFKDTPIGVLITPRPVYNYPNPDEIILGHLQTNPCLPCASVSGVTTTDVYTTEGHDEVLMRLPDEWTALTTKEFNHVSFDIMNINTVDTSKISILIYQLDENIPPVVTCRQDPLPCEGLDIVISPQINLYFDATLANIFNHSIVQHDMSFVTFFEYKF